MNAEAKAGQDVGHIQSEIRQLRNQQFIITTSGITIFGVVTAWLLQGDTIADRFLKRVALESILLVLLFFLYLWGWRLRNLVLTMGSYLRNREWSLWEFDYLEFTSQKYISQMKQQSIMFFLLGLISLGALVVSSLPLIWTRDAAYSFSFNILLHVIYSIIVLGMGFGGWFFSKDEVENRWRQILKNPSKQANIKRA